ELTTIVPDPEKPEFSGLAPFRHQRKRVREIWLSDKDAIAELLKDPALNGRTYGSLAAQETSGTGTGKGLTKRDAKVQAFAGEMNRYIDPRNTGFPIPKDIEKFTTSGLAKATRKNQVPPAHRFFEACEDLWIMGSALRDEMEAYLLYLKRELFVFGEQALSIRKKDENIQFFDDLLIHVHQALGARRGDRFAEKIRQQYRAALIDEFQDTDPVQYDIFTRIFSADESLLFLIGDPKQAIYSFRGADVFSYMDAARQVSARHTLTENWRSSPELLSAVNTLFSNVTDPFIYDEIPFSASRPGRGEPATSPDGNSSSSPLTVWFLDSDTDKPVTKAIAVPQIAEAVADEILALLSSGDAPGAGAGPDVLDAGQIAVLVRTHRQARIVHTCLSDRNIPSVLCNSGHIFDTHEAMEIHRILTSIAEPANETLHRLAMTTDLIGMTAREMDVTGEEPPWWMGRMLRFSTYQQIWNEKGFIRMFRTFLAREGVRSRLLGFRDGQRRVTNVLHLAELLHQASVEQKIGAPGLLKWLSEHRNGAPGDPEEHQLRLENDEHAVKIVTIHKSKGLEYDVVFCPFGWEGIRKGDQEALFHDPDNDNRLTFDMAPDKDSLQLALSRKEALAENLRLLYVALTRAKKRCYLVWGHLNGTGTSGISYLLSDGLPGSPDDVVGALGQQMSPKTGDELYGAVQDLVARSKGRIAVSPLPRGNGDPDATYDPQQGEPDALFSRAFSGHIPLSWKISSYSSLITSHHAGDEWPDYDEQSLHHEPSSLATDVAPDRFGDADPDGDKGDIFAFPKGARAGTFFHELFEHLDFTAVGPPIGDKVRTGLLAYGFEEDWTQPVVRLAEKVVSTPLLDQQPDLKLSAIDNGKRINEMEFCFPVDSFQPADLQDIFKQYGHDEIASDFPEQLGRLNFSASGGFLKGYVDLIFTFENRFYLLDWKSNMLGEANRDYDIDALKMAMKNEFYILQYHLYTLALHRYLALTQPNYHYDNDFGGVFYVFIRGVDPRHGSDSGIYYDRPEAALVHALGSRLIPGYEAQ
ncbi:MAG: exodeoxyribonuclease V subunit beta, partial [Desulfobacterales bacterium]